MGLRALPRVKMYSQNFRGILHLLLLCSGQIPHFGYLHFCLLLAISIEYGHLVFLSQTDVQCCCVLLNFLLRVSNSTMVSKAIPVRSKDPFRNERHIMNVSHYSPSEKRGYPSQPYYTMLISYIFIRKRKRKRVLKELGSF